MVNRHMVMDNNTLAICKKKVTDVDFGSSNVGYLLIFNYEPPKEKGVYYTLPNFKFPNTEVRYAVFDIGEELAAIFCIELKYSLN